MGYKVGIDLGTTFSAVAYVSADGRPEMIPNAEGERVTPSICSFDEGEIYVGRVAKQRAVVYADRTVKSVKRHIGEEGHVIKIGGTNYLPQEISALVLSKLRQDAEMFLGEKIDEAIITVPAYFNTNQKAITKEAGEIAALKVNRVLDEPTAAAMSYGLDRTGAETIVVYDLGGGTFDVSVLTFRKGRYSVLTTSGDNKLGGDDFDMRIVDYLINQFALNTGYDLRDPNSGKVSPETFQRLLDAAEEAKKQLSTLTQTRITVPFVVPEKALSLDVALSREQFEKMSYDLLVRTQKPLRTALADADASPEDIDAVLLAGGSTRMPMVRNFVAELMGKEALLNLNPDECVALGAAIAANQGTRSVTFIASHSIGVETEGGVFTPLIEKGATLPTMGEQEFTTSFDDQTAINFPIFEGEARKVADNTLLGEIRIDGLEPAPAGVPKVRVGFELSTEGILTAVAENTVTGRSISLEIEGLGLQPARKAVARERVGELANRIMR